MIHGVKIADRAALPQRAAIARRRTAYTPVRSARDHRTRNHRQRAVLARTCGRTDRRQRCEPLTLSIAQAHGGDASSAESKIRVLIVGSAAPDNLAAELRRIADERRPPHDAAL